MSNRELRDQLGSRAAYRTGEVARVLGVPADRIRSLVRQGYVRPSRGPRREFRFTFQELLVLRTAQGLKEQGVSAQRIRRLLQKLREQLPSDRPLSSVQVRLTGQEVVVCDGDESWEPLSGQLLLDFRSSEMAAEIARLGKPRFQEKSDPDSLAAAADLDQSIDLIADDWYFLGCELEGADVRESAACYEKAIQLDSRHVDARLNLGRLRHQEGNLHDAERWFREALDLEADNPTAAFNLGVVLHDSSRFEAAADCYRRALEADPQLKEAHYNLARICESRGDRISALRHLKAFKRLSNR